MTASTHADALLTHTDGRQQLIQCYRDGLLNDTLPFWFPRCLDTQHGGYLHCFDADGSLIDDDKSVWAQGRMSWLLFTLYNTVEQRPEWLQWATQGLDFIRRHGFDVDGRMYFQVTRAGRPLRKRRYAYSESFAAIAFAAHYQATGDPQSAARARQLFEHFTTWNFTPGLMPPKFTDERPLEAIAPRMMTLVTAQELRATLGDDANLTHWIDRSIHDLRHKFYQPERQVVLESVAPNGELVDTAEGRLLNPGHAIEAAWFILREAQHRHDDDLVRLGCEMLDCMWQRGWDDEFGGLFYFRDALQKPVQEYWHDMKFWWPHNEAIIATLLAYELTGDTRYAQQHQQVHDWSHTHFADPQYGEWFGYLHRDGTRSTTTKGNLWKSCFHHPRMQLLCWQQLARSSASSFA